LHPLLETSFEFKIKDTSATLRKTYNCAIPLAVVASSNLNSLGGQIPKLSATFTGIAISGSVLSNPDLQAQS